MAKFNKYVEASSGSKFILQGNEAFALGVIHAGYHCVDGYPGTPSTEVIDKSLAHVQDRINVGWDVNEAVAVAVGVGHAAAGFDTVVTMKTPGAFQAGDAITTAAFYKAPAGALVFYVASDYVPSSTQHVIDLRYFFASSRIPVLEPRNHQEMYEIAWEAADISRRFQTPVAILASGILCHSEGLVETCEARVIEPLELPKDMKGWMGMPFLARINYDHATTERIPTVQEWTESSDLTRESGEDSSWGIIVTGESDMIVREALATLDLKPKMLSLAHLYPYPKNKIREFAEKIEGPLFVFEDGDRFFEERVRLMGIDVIGKGENSTITNWTPQQIIDVLTGHLDIEKPKPPKTLDVEPVRRPPSICPGCPYRAFALTVAKLRKQKKIYASFGDIGCSTLLYFLDALDTCMCMGASDSMRQGVVLSRPELASKTISVIGDSCECHSGLDSTRNAVFRNTPGVKVILDNRITAMTGGQPAPTSPANLAGVPNKFNLVEAVKAEQVRTVVVDSYDIKAVEAALQRALELAEQGEYSVLVLQGACIQEVKGKEKVCTLAIDYDKCKRCGLCNICPGIEVDADKTPHFTNLCTNCGSGAQVCLQRCPFGAIHVKDDSDSMGAKSGVAELPAVEAVDTVTMEKDALPDTLRLAIRGIGGQGNLFFGKVLSAMALKTPYADLHIVKGDTHGMAQLGGPVISTFCCGDVHSPVLAPHTVDVLVAMEMSEVLRPGFLELLKPGGTVVFNTFRALPPNTKLEDYPDIDDIHKVLEGYTVIEIDANRVVYELGDKASRTANVAVLGLLSTIEPFSTIPEEIWLEALMSVSPTDHIKSANTLSFKAGRNVRQS